MKKWAPRVLLAAALAGLSAFLLKGDVWTFWTWWLLAFLMGNGGNAADWETVCRI